MALYNAQQLARDRKLRGEPGHNLANVRTESITRPGCLIPHIHTSYRDKFKNTHEAIYGSEALAEMEISKGINSLYLLLILPRVRLLSLALGASCWRRPLTVENHRWGE